MRELRILRKAFDYYFDNMEMISISCPDVDLFDIPAYTSWTIQDMVKEYMQTDEYHRLFEEK